MREPNNGMTNGSDGLVSDEAIFTSARAALSPLHHIRNSRLRKAAEAFTQNRLEEAERLTVAFLADRPDDEGALNLLAETALRLGRHADAEAPLARCVALYPEFVAARFNYANVLFRLSKASEAIHQLDVLLEREPDNPLFIDLKAAACAKMGEFEDALKCRRKLVETFPGTARIWLAYGHALRSAGLTQQCIAAFRKAIELSPSLGEAYWALANLKTFRFDDNDIALMEDVLARPGFSAEDRAPLHYALGKALSDRELWSRSFENYARANAIMRIGETWDPDYNSSRVTKLKSALTPEFFDARAGFGYGATDPIFIVGLQRAGSTLVEQILASHSAIEGTGELTDIAFLAGQISRETGDEDLEVSDLIGGLEAVALGRLGEQYLENTSHRRKLGRPFFTDKQPYNFWYIGLIHLILPNARIIDVRRHPLGCCFSNFSHHYASRSRTFTHRLTDMGRYYRDYVELMAHFDWALPGRIYRVVYERLVEDPETEIRRLLDHLGLPFQSSCLEFHKNARKFDSASSEQVRTPIFREGVERWRHYEPWLTPLKTGLGDVLDKYPDVPAFE